MVKNECLPNYPQDGICHSEDKHGVQTIDSMEKVTNIILQVMIFKNGCGKNIKVGK
jgi:hypothetical protein